jgi:8-oxo-dGTP pyrophosphatase MutT (NUDIX family)
MNTFIVNVECAIEHDGKFLLIQRPAHVHAGGLFAFPGGKVEVEDGKNPNILIEAIKREVREEVGLNLIDPIRYVTSSYFVSKKSAVVGVIFHCKIKNSLLDLKPSEEETTQVAWMSQNEICDHSLSPPWLKFYLECVINDSC